MRHSVVLVPVTRLYVAYCIRLGQWQTRGVGPAVPTVDPRANNFEFGDRQLLTKFYEKSSSSYAPLELPDPQTIKRLDMTTSHLPFVETGPVKKPLRSSSLIMLADRQTDTQKTDTQA